MISTIESTIAAIPIVATPIRFAIDGSRRWVSSFCKQQNNRHTMRDVIFLNLALTLDVKSNPFISCTKIIFNAIMATIGAACTDISKI